MAQVLVLLSMPEAVRMQYHDRIKARFPELTVNVVEHHSKVDPYIDSADILMTFGPMMSERVLEKASNLKWIQALGTGVDGIADRASLGKDVIVTNLHGVHGPPVSEAAFMSMLALSRQLPRSVRNQAAHLWDRFPARLLKDKTVGIYGIGVIAEELAPKCKAFGMKVVGISSAKRDVAGFDRVYARDELGVAVRGLDYLVLLTPLSSATKNSIDASVLAAMKPSAYLINLARGGVVDEAALIDSLRNKRIAGAALDVFSQEPLPADHPFWDMENVIVTTHQGGFCDVYVDFAMPVIEHNLRKFLAGDTTGMTNLVRRPA
jgi:phosphoglycerate dehydrogenase-like enzyme